MQDTRVLVETRGTTGEETTSYWFDLPIDVAEFEEKLGVGAESGEYRIIEKVLPFADEVHEHTSRENRNRGQRLQQSDDTAGCKPFRHGVLPTVLQFRDNNICILTYGHDVVQPDTFYYLCNVFTYQFSTFHDTEL